MFGFSFGEVITLMIILILLVRPEDLPFIIKQVILFIKKVKQIIHESKQIYLDIIENEMGPLKDISKEIEEIHREVSQPLKSIVIDSDGNQHEAYNVAEATKYDSSRNAVVHTQKESKD